ncbi:MAG: metal ABC transporter permease [Myxococcota bacterium]
MVEQISFWGSFDIWRDAMLVSVMSAAALSYLGVWMVLGRVVWLPLALSQVSSIGLVLAFIAGDLLGMAGHEGHLFLPEIVSLVFTGLVSIYFARRAAGGDQSTVVAYLLSASAVLIAGGFIRGDLHDIQSVLFGNAVLVEHAQVYHVGAAILTVTILHVLFGRKMLFSIFDPDAAGASGVNVFRHNAILYLTFAVMISFSTRAIGALPVFAFCVLPPMFALRLTKTMRAAFVVSVAAGMFSAAAGYYLSFVAGIPAGASMAAVAAMLLAMSYMRRDVIQ